MLRKKDVAVAIILSIVTCGIYGIYWFVTLTDDVRLAAEDKDFQSGGVAFILTLITCGIYGIYWAYKMGELMKIAAEKNGLTPQDNAILYLVLQLIGLSIVNNIIIQSDLNKIVDLKGAN